MDIERRRILRFLAGITASISTGVYAQPHSQDDQYFDKEEADKWIRAWMMTLGSATGALHMGRFADRMYYILKSIQWRPNAGLIAPEVNVPVGFVTDLASIPRIFWTLLPPDGLYTYPAILHDYLYWEQITTRREADRVLKYAMEEFNVPSYKVSAIYGAVRAGGQSSWKRNAALKNSGEQRILKHFPSDPTTTWEKWKNNPRAFS